MRLSCITNYQLKIKQSFLKNIFFKYIIFFLTDIIAAIDPFQIPQELIEDFLEDYLKTVKDLKLIDYVYYNEEDSVRTRIDYRLITVFALK